MAHTHHHHSHASGETSKSLLLAFVLNLSFSILEVWGGFYTNSIAVISDAFHDFGDSLALGMAYYLERVSSKQKDTKYTFGYRRFSLLGAAITSVVLFVGSLFILSAAIQRLMSPQPVNPQGMILLALVGISINGFAAYKLSRDKSLNHKMAMWHLLEDALGWAAVLITGTLIVFVNLPILDPILSILITLFILKNVIRNAKQVLRLFLQAVPEEIQLQEIEASLCQIPQVLGVNALQIWSLDGEHHVLNCHLVVPHQLTISEALQIKAIARDKLKIYHLSSLTIEIDTPEENHFH